MNDQTLSSAEMYENGCTLKTRGLYEEAIEQFTAFLLSGKGSTDRLIDACIELSQCYQELGRYEDALAQLYHSFIYDLPNAGVCCHIGEHFVNCGEYHKAIFWYELVFRLDRDKLWEIEQADYYGYIPNLMLSVCYNKLGENLLSIHYLCKAEMLGSISDDVPETEDHLF